MQEVDHLVKMANQITENFSFHDDAVERIADHLRKFWAPSMLEKLIDFKQGESDELKPALREAITRLENT